jgi:hypothetical protein
MIADEIEATTKPRIGEESIHRRHNLLTIERV